MKDMRVLGSTIEKQAGLLGYSPGSASVALGCTEEQYLQLLKGRFSPSYRLLRHIAEVLQTTTDELLKGDHDYYKREFVHCMDSFKDPGNREIILDIIDDYLTLQASLN
jgi:transcriptional regulator with XRE-family HTH domain